MNTCPKGQRRQWGMFGKVVSAMALSLWVLLIQGCGKPANPVTSELVSIKITPSTALLALGGVRQMLATGTYADGTQQDLTAQVTWSTTTTGTGPNVISVTPAGIASGVALGYGTVSAAMGPVVSVLPLIVSTNGYQSSTIGILSAPYKNTVVDIGYQPISQFKGAGGVYEVQAVNLDGDLFSNSLPVQTALIASVGMPAGFVPDATAASQTSLKVAVISYSSPDVVVIDASNDSTDLASNTIIATFTSPVTKTATFHAKHCMICAAVVNPADDKLLLSTAQGYYTMDLSTGTFTALALTPPALPAPAFSLNPVAADPYVLSPTFGQDPNVPAEVQFINLTSSTVLSETTFGLTAPNAATINLFGSDAAIVDTGANTQALANLTDPNHPASTQVSNLSLCQDAHGPAGFDMTAVGIAANPVPLNVAPILFLSQHSSSCVGFELWPIGNLGPLDPTLITFGFGDLPATPDGSAFVNGSDPNAIAVFSSVVDKKNYGVLVNAGQTWIAKVNFGTIVGAENGFNGFFLPNGVPITSTTLHAGVGGDAIVYLPTTGTVSLSAGNIDFGSQPVGTASLPSSVVLTNAGLASFTPQIAIAGTNAGDFTQTNDCPVNLGPQGTCTITVTFTPGALGARAGTLTVGGGDRTLSLPLTGTGS